MQLVKLQSTVTVCFDMGFFSLSWKSFPADMKSQSRGLKDKQTLARIIQEEA